MVGDDEVIASDKFKGSATGTDVAAAIAAGIAEVVPVAEVSAVPVADGGEGTLEAAIAAGFERVLVRANVPTATPVEAAIAVRDGEAIVEMAAVSGLDRRRSRGVRSGRRRLRTDDPERRRARRRRVRGGLRARRARILSLIHI